MRFSLFCYVHLSVYEVCGVCTHVCAWMHIWKKLASALSLYTLFPWNGFLFCFSWTWSKGGSQQAPVILLSSAPTPGIIDAFVIMYGFLNMGTGDSNSNPHACTWSITEPAPQPLEVISGWGYTLVVESLPSMFKAQFNLQKHTHTHMKRQCFEIWILGKQKDINTASQVHNISGNNTSYATNGGWVTDDQHWWPTSQGIESPRKQVSQLRNYLPWVSLSGHACERVF